MQHILQLKAHHSRLDNILSGPRTKSCFEAQFNSVVASMPAKNVCQEVHSRLM